MAVVFISHSSVDNYLVKKVVSSFKKNEISYLFLDFDHQNGIKAGEEWERRLYVEIKRSSAMILLLSPAWIRSKWCFAEYQQARALGKEILPLIVDHGKENEVKEWIAQHIQQNDLTKSEKALENIVLRIKEIALDTQMGFHWDSFRLPYPGLFSFSQEDAAVFFGREEETRELIDLLNAMSHRSSPKFINIVAASGLGKSSLLKAGVLARIKLVYPKKWIVLPVLRPLARPLYELSKCLATVLNRPFEYKKIYEKLQSDRYVECLDDIIDEITLLQESSVAILLPIDQAEELYTVSLEDERKVFLQAIEYLVEKKENFYTIWTLRSDYLKVFQTDTFTIQLHKYEHIFSLGALATENVSSIITKPLEICGVVIEERLVEKLKEDMKTTDALPLLAMTLYELYSRYAKSGRLTLQEYQSLGDGWKNPLENIVQKKADEAISRWREDLQGMELLKRAFIPHLVRTNDRQDAYVKRKANLDEMPFGVHELLEALVQARLLIKTREEGAVKIEIAHEALIRSWSLLRQWLREEHTFLIVKAQLEVSLQEWQNADVKDKKRALLSGLRLEKVLEWKERLTDSHEIDFINESIKHEESIRKKRRNFLIGSFSLVSSFCIFSAFEWYRAEKTQEVVQKKSLLLQKEIEQARHNIGLFFAQKAKMYLHEKKIAKAHLYSYYALSYLSYNKAEEIISLLAGIVVYYPYVKLSYIDTKHSLGVYDVLIVSEDKTLISGAEDCKVIFRSLLDGHLQKTFEGHTDTIYDIVKLKEKNLLITSSRDTTIRIWDYQTGETIKVLTGHTNKIYRILLTPDKKTLISASDDKTIRLWDLQTYTLKKIFRGHKDRINDITVSEDGKRLYSVSYDKSIGIWELEKYVLVKFIKDFNKGLHRIVLMDDETLILSSKGKDILFWNLKKNQITSVLKGHKDMVYDMKLDRERNVLISTSHDKTIRIWDLNTKEQLEVMEVMKEPSYRMGYDEKYKILVTPSWDFNVYIWDLSTYQRKHLLPGHSKKIYNLAIGRKGTFFVTASRDKSLRLWDLKTGKVKQVFKDHTDSAFDVKIFNDDRKIVSCGMGYFIKIWDIDTSKCLKTLYYDANRIYSIALSKKNDFLVSGSENKLVLVWDLKNFHVKKIFKGHTDVVYHVAVSSDDKMVASASYDKTVKLWNLKEGKLLKTFQGHTDRVYFVMFDKDMHYLYSCGKDQSIRKWDIQTGECIKVFLGHTHRVYWLALTPDEKILASASRDHTIRLWEASSGKLLHILKGHKRRIYSVDITPDGKTLISVSWDKTIKYWDIKSGKLLKTLKEYTDVTIVSDEKKIIKLANGKILDMPTIRSEIKNLEKQFQAKLDGIDLVPYKQPFERIEWSETNPFYMAQRLKI